MNSVKTVLPAPLVYMCRGELPYSEEVKDLVVFDGRYGPFIYAECEMCGASSKRFRVSKKDDVWESRAARQAEHFWNQRV